MGLDDRGYLTDRGNEPKALIARVARGLKSNPELQKQVVEVALEDHSFRSRSILERAVTELLYRSELPDDLDWHLDQAVRWAAVNSENVGFHLVAFRDVLAKRSAGIDTNLDRARARLANRREALEALESTLKTDLESHYLRERIQDQHPGRTRSGFDLQLLAAVRSQENKLRENRAHAGLLYGIVHKYCGGSFNAWSQGDLGQVTEALGGNGNLANVAVSAIRRSPERGDLPEHWEILKLRMDDQISLFTLPILAGLAEWNTEEILGLSDGQLRTALALRLVAPTFAGEAGWYAVCLRERASLVAEVLVPFGRGLFRAGERYLPDLYRLSREPAYKELAEQVTMPLLRAFPVRARADQHNLLIDLLQSALVNCDRTELRNLIDRKAALKSVTKTQRLYWMAAGVALDPDHFRQLLSGAGDAYVRRQILERMFPPAEGSVHQVPGLTDGLEPAAIEFLIHELGSQQNPLGYEGGVSFGWGWESAIGVENLIARLGRNPVKSASIALERLAKEPPVSQWKHHLERALETQQVVRRDTDHIPSTPAEVISALHDGPPASAADLGELTVDRLERIKEELRRTSANLWRQFWNEDSGMPKHEDACRDSLVAMLASRLPPGCDAQPEGQYAGNRRSDIRVTASGWNVPIEIKKNSHREVWSAVRNQLLPRYANDPATEGLGLYLVLWFGPERTAGVPRARKPTTPDEMRERLLTDLTSEERRRAAVVVLDVTAP